MNDSRIGNISTAAANFAWSSAEKKVARAAFDMALGREFQAVMKKTKESAAKIEQPSDMWDLEAYLTRCRKRIDREFDYRYSVLLEVFAGLIVRGRLREYELHGLGGEKIECIQRYVGFARRDD